MCTYVCISTYITYMSLYIYIYTYVIYVDIHTYVCIQWWYGEMYIYIYIYRYTGSPSPKEPNFLQSLHELQVVRIVHQEAQLFQCQITVF